LLIAELYAILLIQQKEKEMQIIQYNDGEVYCYGELDEISNFEVVCENEEDDDTWCNGNPDSEDGIFSSWEEVVRVLSRYYNDIIEITAV